MVREGYIKASASVCVCVGTAGGLKRKRKLIRCSTIKEKGSKGQASDAQRDPAIQSA